MGGVGKTALALTWLHHTRELFPHAQLYADLGASRDGPPADPGEVLHGFLTAMGSSAVEIPPETSQRAAAFRAATTGLHLVVLLDDAVSAAQVSPLLPAGPDATVLVTSRWRLTDLGTQDAQFFELNPLDAVQSRTALATGIGDERVDAEPDAADEIVALCGGLPLALSVAAARLRARPRRSLAREASAYTRSVSNAGEGRVPLAQAVFDGIYQKLPPNAARVYRACGVHPGSILSAEVLAAGLHRPVDLVEEDIEELVEGNLLADADGDRLTQHELLHRDAGARADQEIPADARLSMLRTFTEWYLERALAADELIHPHRERFAGRQSAEPASTIFPDRTAATDWWRVDLPALRAVFAKAVGHGWDELIWKFCEASWGFFLHHRDYAPWITMYQDGVAAALRCGNSLVEARLRSQLGFIYTKLGRFDQAAEENVVALRLGQRQQHVPTQATALSLLGGSAQGQDDWEGALDFYRQSADLHAGAGIHRGVALCRRRSGEVLARLGRYGEAEAELTAAASTMAELGDVTQYSRAVMTLAKIHSRQGLVDQAVQLLGDALTTTRSLNSPYYLAELLSALGTVELEHGHREEGRHHLAEARELYTEMGDPRGDNPLITPGQDLQD
ncbi:NB-ARC domain-containing protein [Amycolatopsis sp. H20-H5]|uniref:NB-ARC domain-containing protein n=1 Tax=Amycolatopsis sp. H20-H5 TaxID=3046309 RepID=UPI003FA3DA3B